MQHVVFWSSQSGPAFERVPALTEAIDLVARLRNEHGVIDAEVHELSAVPLQFRTVVVVEPVGGGAAAASAFVAPAAPHQAGPDDYVAPLGAGVPSVVPDLPGPFTSLATDEPADAVPHLVGLPSVAPDTLSDLAAELSAGTPEDAVPALHAVAEVPDQATGYEPDEVTGYEPAPEAPVRSLGLFA